MPAVTFSGLGDVIIRDDARRRLESAELTGAEYRAVEKVRIVRLEWETWNADGAEPAFCPDSGEPEDYILGLPHDPELAWAMGDLWELVAKTWGTATVEVIGARPFKRTVTLAQGEGPMPDLFKAEGVRDLFASDRARAAIEEIAGQWIEFAPVAEG